MLIRITNTLSGKKEEFVPLTPGRVGIYTCGPTVYGLTHIGNARPAVFFDLVRRFFVECGYRVTWVMNFTDVDDKIIHRAAEEKTSSSAVAQKYAAEYLHDLLGLGVPLPEKQPRVTDHISQIVKLIERLISTGAAYAVDDGEVFFAVRNFPSYGKLSKKKIDDLRTGVRIQPGERKRDPLDFSLWKPRKSDDEPAWASPWGMGRPGWHIECSAMAMEYLGETFDIHGGGIDLMHPHHENEIAQSEAATQKIFAKCWMHNGLISIQREKMSKSLGNIFLTRDFIKKYSSEVLRYLLLSVHYRSPVEFSEAHIREIQAALHRVYSAKKKAQALVDVLGPSTVESGEETALRAQGEGFANAWREALADDFNTSAVLAIVFDYVRALNTYTDKKGFRPTARTAVLAKGFISDLNGVGRVLNLFNETASEYLGNLRTSVAAERGIDALSIDRKVAARAEARAKKDFSLADVLRAELLSMGVEIKDSPTGSEWDVIYSKSDQKE